MTDFRSKIYELYSLEQLSGGGSWLHRIHPLAKMLVTACYLLCVASTGRYAFFALAPYVFYPVVLLALADIPFSLVAKRAAVALPFCLFAGISNLYFDRTPAFWLGPVAVSGGALSLATILLRVFLCVCAVLALVALTPLAQLTGQLRRLHVPWLVVSLFEMVYRYLGTLLEEAADLRTAYRLRRGAQKGISLRDSGCLIGQLLLRSFDRAARIYDAMKCRGYAGQMPHRAVRPFSARDWAFLLACCVPTAALRLGFVPLLFPHH
ncbi:MAG: cobalt ECF transporter T component CbiQ [Faecalibacterium sp.]|jgi:cobalt/nickel transport system permease protein|nr:cobalt ECF transporter T component CbiQ [Faecalibacterium sp.]